MKRFKVLLAALLLLTGIFADQEQALASPPDLPSAFYGSVLIGVANVPDGTSVTAWIDGVQYAETTSFTTLVGSQQVSVYTLAVSADDPETPETEGGVDGDSLVFGIGEYVADQTATWHSGTDALVSLSADQYPGGGTVTPNSGSGSYQNAVFVVSGTDPNGWKNIARLRFLLGTSTSPVGTALITYDQNTNNLWLRDDSGITDLGGYAPGSSTFIENLQVRVNVVGCSVMGSSGLGSAITVTLSLSFKSSYVGLALNEYVESVDDQEQTTGWLLAGVYTLTNSAPSVVQVFPNSGSSAPGVAQDFWLTVRDADGRDDVGQAMLLINTSISALNGVYVTYDKVANKLWLRNDAGTTNLGGYAPGSANTIENSQVIVDVANCTLSGTGTDVIVKVRLRFKQAFGGIRFLYGKVVDLGGLVDGWRTLGLWSISGTAPALVGVAPGSGTTDPGVTQLFTVTSTDPDTYNDIHYTFLLINTIIDRGNAVYVTYDQYENKVYLRNDIGFVNGAGYAPGSANLLENSQGIVDVSQCSVTKSGNQLQVTFAIRFKPLFSGIRDVYGQVVDYAMRSTGWTKYGTWTINGSAPSIALLYPASGSVGVGVPQVFSVQASDPDGYGNVRYIYYLMNTAISGANAVYITYDRLYNKLYLRDNAGTTNLGGYSPGSANTIENSQVVVDVSGCSAGPNSGNLALNLRLRFKSGFVGSKNQYIEVVDYLNLADGWKQKGTWTVTP